MRLHSRDSGGSHMFEFDSIAMTKDDSAVVFGEDVAFGGVFRCTMVRSSYSYSLTAHLTPIFN